MQTYSNHQVTSQGLVIVTQEGTEVLVPFESAKQLIKDLRRQLGDFHDHDERPQPGPMKYGQVEK